MDHIIISTQIRCECGPTIVGDVDSDSQLMKLLDAKIVHQLGNNFPEYISQLPPRIILNRLAKQDYQVLGMYDWSWADLYLDIGESAE